MREYVKFTEFKINAKAWLVWSCFIHSDPVYKVKKMIWLKKNKQISNSI